MQILVNLAVLFLPKITNWHVFFWSPCISYTFFTKREKLIFGPGNHEIGNTAKFRRDGEKQIPDSDSATQNHVETTGFIPVQFWLLTCVMNKM